MPETTVPARWRDSDKPAWRLAYWVRERRRELDITQLEVGWAGGPSNTTLTKIENGLMATLNRKTARALDHALKWEQGSARGIFDRGDAPVSLSGKVPTVDRETARRVIAELPGLTDDERQAMLALLDAPPSGGDGDGNATPIAETG